MQKKYICNCKEEYLNLDKYILCMNTHKQLNEKISKEKFDIWINER